MKLTIDRADMLQALGHVQNIVERRNTIPVLSNVLMEAEAGSLRLTATDLDIQARDTAPAQIMEAGRITAPAQTLFEVIRKLPDGAEISLGVEPDNQRLSIRAGRAYFALPTLPAGDFQPMEDDMDATHFEINAKDLKRLIDRTSFAISTEETRYYLNGIYIHGQTTETDQLLRAVATDGHRLAMAEMLAPEGAAGLSGAIIPRKTVGEIRRMIDSSEEMVKISASEAKIAFHFGSTHLISKLIDGDFPDYARVIPRDNPHHLNLDNKAFEQAVDRVATVSSERSRSVKLSLADNILTLSVQHAETGQGTEELEVTYEGEALAIGFNAKYLLDVSKQFASNQALFEFADSASPVLVRDPEDESAQFVLMPLRV